jgi:methionyl-tRNA formyltransferase
VAEEALARGLPLRQPEILQRREELEFLARLAPDLILTAAYGKIFRPALLDLPRLGCLNLHPSLLPRHRGASPIPATILDGDAATGVTLFRMDEGMDTGPIVAVERLALSGREDAPALERRLAEMAAVLLSRSLGPWLRGELAAVPQPADGVTVTRLLRREDGRLDPRRAAPVLERQVRAYRPWPGTWLETEAGRLGVLQGTLAPGDGVSGGVPPAAVGTLVPDGPGLALVAGDGGLLRLLEVQPAGGRVMDGAAFRRGHPRIVGTVVGTVAG